MYYELAPLSLSLSFRTEMLQAIKREKVSYLLLVHQFPNLNFCKNPGKAKNTKEGAVMPVQKISSNLVYFSEIPGKLREILYLRVAISVLFFCLKTVFCFGRQCLRRTFPNFKRCLIKRIFFTLFLPYA